MAVPLLKDRNTPMKDGELLVVPVAASVQIFAGALVVANATGFAAPGSTATTLTYLGRAEQNIDNTTGADGDQSVSVRRGKAFKFANDGSITQANLGKTAYIVDDETVAATNGGSTRSAAGVIIMIESDGVWIH